MCQASLNTAGWLVKIMRVPFDQTVTHEANKKQQNKVNEPPRPKLEGIEPVSLHPYIGMYSRVERLPSDAGRVPVRRLLSM